MSKVLKIRLGAKQARTFARVFVQLALLAADDDVRSMAGRVVKQLPAPKPLPKEDPKP